MQGTTVGHPRNVYRRKACLMSLSKLTRLVSLCSPVGSSQTKVPMKEDPTFGNARREVASSGVCRTCVKNPSCDKGKCLLTQSCALLAT